VKPAECPGKDDAREVNVEEDAFHPVKYT
jgi:hypothetical protein